MAECTTGSRFQFEKLLSIYVNFAFQPVLFKKLYFNIKVVQKYLIFISSPKYSYKYSCFRKMSYVFLRASPEPCRFSSALSARVLEVCLRKPILKISLMLVDGFYFNILLWEIFIPLLLFGLCFQVDWELNIRNCWRDNYLLSLSFSHFLLIRKKINQRNLPKCPNQHHFLYQQFLALYPDTLHRNKIMIPNR